MYTDNDLFGPMMRHGYYGQGFHEHSVNSVEWAILGLAVLILIGVILLLTGTWQRRRYFRQAKGFGRGPSGEPLAILGARYARGEIGRDEYLQASRDLGASPELAETATPATKPPARRRTGRGSG
jgi:uncharacterized membrane protein